MARNDVIETVVTREAPEFEIADDGLACIRIQSGQGIIEIYCSPHILLAASARAMQAIADWQNRQADPIIFRREPDYVRPLR